MQATLDSPKNYDQGLRSHSDDLCTPVMGARDIDSLVMRSLRNQQGSTWTHFHIACFLECDFAKALDTDSIVLSSAPIWNTESDYVITPAQSISDLATQFDELADTYCVSSMIDVDVDVSVTYEGANW